MRGPLRARGLLEGGRLALHVALAHPERVTRLVLVSTTAGIEDAAERAAAARAPTRRSRRGWRRDGRLMTEVADRWGAQPLFATSRREVAAAARADRLSNDPAHLAAALRGIGTGVMAPLWERLGELRDAGRRAGRRARREVRRARRGGSPPRCRAATLTIVPGAGHALAARGAGGGRGGDRASIGAATRTSPRQRPSRLRGVEEGQSGAAERRVAELREQLQAARAERDRFDAVRQELFAQLKRSVEIQRRAAREARRALRARPRRGSPSWPRELARAQEQIAELDAFEARRRAGGARGAPAARARGSRRCAPNAIASATSPPRWRGGSTRRRRRAPGRSSSRRRSRSAWRGRGPTPSGRPRICAGGWPRPSAPSRSRPATTAATSAELEALRARADQAERALQAARAGARAARRARSSARRRRRSRSSRRGSPPPSRPPPSRREADAGARGGGARAGGDAPSRGRAARGRARGARAPAGRARGADGASCARSSSARGAAPARSSARS